VITPALPADVITGTRGRYVEAYERITGESFDDHRARVGATTLDDEAALDRLREERG